MLYDNGERNENTEILSLILKFIIFSFSKFVCIFMISFVPHSSGLK